MNQKYEPLSTNTFKMFFDGVLLLIVGGLFFNLEFSRALWWWIIPLGFLYATAGIFYFKALQQEKVHLLIPYSQASQVLFLFAGAFVFLGEAVSFLNIVGAGLIILGIYLALSPGQLQFPLLKKGIIFMSINTLLTVLYLLLLKKAVVVLPAHPITLAIGMYFSTTLFLIAYMLLVGYRENHNFNFQARSGKILISAIFGALGTLLLYAALETGKATQIYPLAGLQAVFVFFLAYLLLGEKVSWFKLSGTLLVFGGVFLVLA